MPSGSLRSGFSWMLLGNVVYAAAQWGILSLVAKLGSSEMLGQYALALAITTPVIMLSHLNLRAALATDVGERHPFGDYLAVRLATTAAGLCAIAFIAFFSANSWTVAAVILLMGISQSAENVSDIYHGALQRRDEMGQIARSMIARGIVSVAAVGIAMWMTHDLVSAMLALVASRLVVLLAYDRPRGSSGERLFRSGRQA
ncbi:MAG: lipopolysaccharide biosynthesis protein, partial [Acidobacteria bacterium]|nr:lipopolysaccharide biosynthesis protein [Acidobacteriota bacterium]